MNRGIIYAITAYSLWGVFPLYWKAIKNVPATQILGHRIIWSFIFLVLVVILSREWPKVRSILRNGRTLTILFMTASLLSVNWLLYIWGVKAGFVVETSFGYFINPLVNVLLGVIFLRERLRPLQWLPLGLAALGVLYMTLSSGSLPWIALVLALTFGLYGLLKKVLLLSPISGLTVETALMVPPSILFILFTFVRGESAMASAGWLSLLLLAGSGFVTSVPLLLFNAAARTTNLSTMGLLQYIAPSLQLMTGVLILGEAFTLTHLVGFGLIWTALLLYTVEGLAVRRKLQSASNRPSQPLDPARPTGD
jgi:chloramphenicol-sensitive protein RarD